MLKLFMWNIKFVFSLLGLNSEFYRIRNKPFRIHYTDAGIARTQGEHPIGYLGAFSEKLWDIG